MDAQPKIGGFGCFKGALQIPFFSYAIDTEVPIPMPHVRGNSRKNVQFHKAISYFGVRVRVRVLLALTAAGLR